MIKAIRIELISASVCNRCGDARKRLQKLVEELDDDRIQYREIDVLEELDYAVSLGVLTTPAIAIDGELIYTAMPSLKRLKDELQKRLGSK
tara:strand:- start:8892 stop:9164 length:273 start_codon:yes stop_codon:yes gene_type:complete